MIGHAERGSHQIAFQVHGRADAPPLLLVMGLSLASSAWDDLPARLGATFRVIVFDNRGVGDSRGPRRPYRMRDLADDAAAVLDAAGVARAHVFGISMGGMIALELAVRHPRRVRSLAIGCSTAGTLRGERPAFGVWLSIVAGLLRPGHPRALGHLARILVSDEFHAQTPAALGEWLGRHARPASASAALQIAAIATHDVHRHLPHIAVPVLVVTGDGDRLIPPENSRRLARAIPGARLVELPGAGHCFPLEQAEATTRLLAEFFAEIEAREAGLPAPLSVGAQPI